MSTVATGTFQVRMQPVAFEGAEPEWNFGRFLLDKEIAGDLVATTRGQMISAGSAVKGSAGYVAVERVTGTLQGKRGSFVLLHTGIMNRGTPSLSIVVIPDSGTGELVGIEGEFAIRIDGGQHAYEFTYRWAVGEGD